MKESIHIKPYSEDNFVTVLDRQRKRRLTNNRALARTSFSQHVRFRPELTRVGVQAHDHRATPTTAAAIFNFNKVSL